MSEPVALAGLSVYVWIGDGPHTNAETWDATDDPDEYGDSILARVHAEPELTWRLTDGDDHGDGLASYDYVAEVPTMDDLRAFVEWVGDDPADATENMGILTSPEEWGYIPGGLTWELDGMDWNMGGITPYVGVDVSVWPITVEAYNETLGRKQ